jgi:hypothetical protein
MLAAAVALAFSACGGRGATHAPVPKTEPDASPASAGEPSPRQRRRSDLITRDEIEASHVTTVYDVVERLHPNWLHNRSPRSDYVVAFYNERELGPAGLLKGVRVEGVESIRWYDAVIARARFGFGHEAGVIEVVGQ